MGFGALWALRDSRAWGRWWLEGVVGLCACGLWGLCELVGRCGLLRLCGLGGFRGFGGVGGVGGFVGCEDVW